MKRGLAVFVMCITTLCCVVQETDASQTLLESQDHRAGEHDSMYARLEPADIKPSYRVFNDGMEGYEKLMEENKIQNKRYITLIDFTLSSNERRLWVIDLDSLRIVQHSLVSHGKNSGGEYAVKFSNIPNSNMSSIGVFVTGSTYFGKHGESLYLEGVEEGINDNARKRAIVMHGADYATRDFANKYGRLGRSFGCPALPPAKSTQIIDTIKNKSCLYIYFPDKKYRSNSKYIPRS